MSVQRGRLAGREAGSPPRAGRPRAAAVPGRAGGAGRGGGGRRRVPAEPGRRDPRAAAGARTTWTSTGDARRGASDPAPRRRPGRDPRPPRRRSAARPVGARRAGPPHPRATRTRPSSPCGRCSASRSRSPPRARSRGGWWRRSASRWSGRWAAITHRFPTPEALAALDPETLPMPRARAPRAVGDGGRAVRQHLPGVGPWTAAYVALRSGDDDAFLPTDLGVKHGLAALGADPARAAELAEAWRPYRGYAVAHLWAAHLVVERRDAADLGLDRVAPAPLRHPPPQPDHVGRRQRRSQLARRRRARCRRPPRPASAAARGAAA